MPNGTLDGVRNLSISCCDQLLNVFVILSHSGGLLLINLFAQQLRQLGDICRNPPGLVFGEQLGRRSPTGSSSK
jgi:hypothetical protein